MNKPAITNMEPPCMAEIWDHDMYNTKVGWLDCYTADAGDYFYDIGGQGYDNARLASGIWHPWAGGKCPVDGGPETIIEKEHWHCELDQLIKSSWELQQMNWNFFGRFKILEYK